MATVPSICRSCLAFCPILVDVADGRAIAVRGDPAAREFEGYTCPKGRALPEMTNSPDRLLHSLKRDAGGALGRITSDQAVSEIAGKLAAIIAEHGPRSVAVYLGNGSALQHPFSATMAAMLLRAMGSPMLFHAGTIDKPAERIVAAMHGYWMGNAPAFADADAWMIIGSNPIISKSTGLPCNNPGMRLKQAVKRGLKLIVIDPRKTEVARRAAIHLQARPGEDPALLAAMIRIIIAEGLHDADFVAENVNGFEALRAAVAPFDPATVAARAGISADSLHAAARTFATARRAFAQCNTGPSFSTHSNAAFYLTLCLNTICGRWLRAGDRVVYPNVLLPAYQPRAQALEPHSFYGEAPMRVRGLHETSAGMPSAALADEILTEGEGKVRALICLGSNPARAFPDQQRAEAALSSLDLLVSLDAYMSATARMADYIVPSPVPLELPAITFAPEALKYAAQGRGYQMPWAQYAPAAVAPPPGSDLIVEHAFFFRLARAMGYQLDWINYYGLSQFVEAPTEVIPFDMDREPSLDDIYELATRNARVPLAEVKAHPHGHRFEIDVPIAPREEGWTQRLDVGNPLIMAELAEIVAEWGDESRTAEFPFQLICHRTNNTMNSIGTTSPSLMKGKYYNPVLLHPNDAGRLGIAEGERVEIRSPSAAVSAIAGLDESLKPGVVALTHGFGAPGDESGDPRNGGTNINRLISLDEADRISGLPRMSAIPVSIRPLALA